MEPYFNPVTKAGYQKIQDEIEALKTQRPPKIKALQVARSLGDLSENADYSAAKRDLRHLESRMRFLNKQLQYAKIYQPKDNDVVEIGKFVTIQFLDDESQETFQIVGEPEVDIDNNKISTQSPIGAALNNHKTGDIVSVKAPTLSYKVKIVSVTIE